MKFIGKSEVFIQISNMQVDNAHAFRTISHHATIIGFHSLTHVPFLTYLV